jgi:hypothetical protein
MKKILLFAFISALVCWAEDSPPAKIAGKWQMSMETPHGVVKGPLDVEQDKAKLTISFHTEMIGSVSGTGTVAGDRVSFSLSVPNAAQSFGFSGSVDGAKMSGTTEMGGAWSATRETAEGAPKPTLGTVSGFRPKSLELGVKSDSGETVWVKWSGDTEVLLAAPGENDLSHAQPGRVEDIARGDRVLVSFVDGMPEARRIVVASASDIARRNAAERLDWENRGITGIVAGREGDDIIVETRSPAGVQRTTVVLTAQTTVRRYAPDSVKFADARPASSADIAVGDQLRGRGDRSAEGDRLTAQDIVFGTFRTTLGTVERVDREKGELQILDLASKQPMLVRVTADTQVKKPPDMQQASRHMSHSAPGNLSQMLQQLPVGSLDDLKPGSMAVVTSTRGSQPGSVTGIMVIAGVEGLIQMAQSQAPGEGPMEALNRMHGGMLAGPNGFSLPAILQ